MLNLNAQQGQLVVQARACTRARDGGGAVQPHLCSSSRIRRMEKCQNARTGSIVAVFMGVQ